MSINWNAFAPLSHPADMLPALRARQFIFMAESNHDTPALQFGMNRVFAELAGHVRHLCLENDPGGFAGDVGRILAVPGRLELALAWNEASARQAPSGFIPRLGVRITAPAVEQRLAIATVKGMGLHGVDVAPSNIYDPDTGNLIPSVLQARLRADSRVAGEIRKAAGSAPALTTYGMGHFGRDNSIETHFAPAERVSLAFFATRQEADRLYPYIQASNRAGGQPRELDAWADYVCCVKSGEVWRNNGFRP